MVKSSTHSLLFMTAIGLSVVLLVGCGSESIKVDQPAFPALSDKYSESEYKEMINECDSIIARYSTEDNISIYSQVKTHLSLLGIYWYNIHGKTVQAKFDSTRTDFFEQRDSAMHVLGRYQEKMFPKYRKLFAKHAAELLWEHDCKAEVIGDKNEILELSGNYFLPNANKKKTFEALQDVAKEMRFKKMRFRWYSSSSDFFDFDINSDSDKSYISR